MRNIKYISAVLYLFILSIIFFTNTGRAADLVPNPPTNLNISSDTIPPPPSPLPPPPRPGNDGLLSGMTPGNMIIPNGWTLITAQGFEGVKPSNESWGLNNGSVTSLKPHSGSKSVEGTFAWDQAAVGWLLYEGTTGSFVELYLSFYEWVDSNALFNDEYFQARFATGSGSTFQEVILDWYWAQDSNGSPAFNQPRATLFAVPQGIFTDRMAGRTDSIPKGYWAQWEIWFRPNAVGQSNGFIRVYLNGTYYTGAENTQLVGRSMANCSVMAGGQYSKLVWMTDYPTCSKCSNRPGDGTDFCTGSKGFFGQFFSEPICSPIDPPFSSFKRFIDDIIVIKK